MSVTVDEHDFQQLVGFTRSYRTTVIADIAKEPRCNRRSCRGPRDGCWTCGLNQHLSVVTDLLKRLNAVDWL